MKKILVASPTLVFLVMVILGLFGQQSAKTSYVRIYDHHGSSQKQDSRL